ncbi:MAG: nucleotide sugar dehydrogenase [Deltaproteobacteria bacterium]|nr:nucleotide sugar dehydrogenase [Deltaproteobacteria bacterium]
MSAKLESATDNLLAALSGRRAIAGIIGLGYVGLPLAATFAEAGFAVYGFDVDAAKIDELRAGRSYIHHLPAERIARLLTQSPPPAGRPGFYPTREMAALAECDAIILCVPTPLTENREPDLSFVVATAETVARHLRPQQLVVLESTTYPGTTDEVVRPILERNGLTAGTDFFLAYSPEREDPNNAQFSTRTIPKLVGGYSARCGQLAAALYGAVVERVVPVSSTRVAEAAKLLENIYRSVNIALVNELKVLFDRMHLDVWEVIDAAATKPFGFTPFYPGPGLGGHCIPVDPFYLTWKARQYELTTRFIELAGEVNCAMPAFVVAKVMDALNERSRSLRGARVLVLGVAYKRDLDDTRESPALKLIELLQDKGALVSYHDPYVPVLKRSRHYNFQLAAVALTAAELGGADVVLIATDHSCFDYQFIVDSSALVVDTRNATRALSRGRDKIVRA